MKYRILIVNTKGSVTVEKQMAPFNQHDNLTDFDYVGQVPDADVESFIIENNVSLLDLFKSRGDKTIKCSQCGSTDFIYKSSQAECSHCGTNIYIKSDTKKHPIHKLYIDNESKVDGDWVWNESTLTFDEYELWNRSGKWDYFVVGGLEEIWDGTIWDKSIWNGIYTRSRRNFDMSLIKDSQISVMLIDDVWHEVLDDADVIQKISDLPAKSTLTIALAHG